MNVLIGVFGEGETNHKSEYYKAAHRSESQYNLVA